jgi:hypothetical protein
VQLIEEQSDDIGFKTSSLSCSSLVIPFGVHHEAGSMCSTDEFEDKR